MNVLFLVGFTLLATANFCIGKRDLLYPAFVFSGLWTLAFLVYTFAPVSIERISPVTACILVAGVIAFSAGSRIASALKYDDPEISIIYDKRVNNGWVKKLLVLYCVAVLPLFIADLKRLSGDGIGGFFVAARVGFVEAVQKGQDPFPNPLSHSAIMIAISTSLVFLIEGKDSKSRTWYCVSLLVASIYCVFATGRTEILRLLVGSTSIYLLISGRRRLRQVLRTVVWSGLLFFALYFVLLFIYKDPASLETGNEGVLQHFIVAYMAGPIAAFNRVVTEPQNYLSEPNHTFQDFLRMWSRLKGESYKAPSKLATPVWVPFSTNVYTLYKHVYLELGLLGMLLTTSLLGFLHNWIYEKAKLGLHLFIFMYGISMFPLFMSIFDDVYFVFLWWSKVILFAILYFTLLRRLNVCLIPHVPYLRIRIEKA